MTGIHPSHQIHPSPSYPALVPLFFPPIYTTHSLPTTNFPALLWVAKADSGDVVLPLAILLQCWCAERASASILWQIKLLGLLDHQVRCGSHGACVWYCFWYCQSRLQAPWSKDMSFCLCNWKAACSLMMLCKKPLYTVQSYAFLFRSESYRVEGECSIRVHSDTYFSGSKLHWTQLDLMAEKTWIGLHC